MKMGIDGIRLGAPLTSPLQESKKNKCEMIERFEASRIQQSALTPITNKISPLIDISLVAGVGLVKTYPPITTILRFSRPSYTVVVVVEVPVDQFLVGFSANDVNVGYS